MLILQRITQKPTLCTNDTDELNLRDNKALVQQKNLYPIVLQALKVKICPIVSKG